MKKKFFGSILIFFSMIIIPAVHGQLKKQPLNFSPKKGIVLIRGYIQYNYSKIPGQINGLHYDFILSVKPNGPFKIVGAKINNKKLRKSGNKYKSNFKLPLDLKTGSLVELKAGITKGGNLGHINYITIASIQVRNLIKEYIFPKPGGKIDMPSSRSILFRWKFSNTAEKTMISLRDSGNAGVQLIRVITIGESQSIPANILKPETEYYLWQKADSSTLFHLSDYTSSRSKLTFVWGYSMRFGTR